MAFDSALFASYDAFKMNGVDTRRVSQSTMHDKVWSFDSSPLFSHSVAGYSSENRPITLVSLGSGPISVFLWAQMHGNESTSSRALLDIFNFFDTSDDEFVAERATILEKLTVHIIPVLNPDGAERFSRLNAVGIDLNRDAVALQGPESKLLKEIRDRYNPLFGFNLHDQGRVYAAGKSGHPATMSFLTPPYNEDRSINEVRERSMKLIGFINDIAQKYIPGKVGKFSDEFEPRAFGDNITKWGTSVVLFESGGFPGDREKFLARKLHFVTILSALHAIANQTYQSYSTENYDRIPFNEKLMFDVIVRNVTIQRHGTNYKLDLGIDWSEHELDSIGDFYLVGKIEEVGDLSVHHGYQEYDGEGLEYSEASVLELEIEKLADISSAKLSQLHKEGYGWVRTQEGLPSSTSHALINVIEEGANIPGELVGSNPTFCLRDSKGDLKYLFINGFEVNTSDEQSKVQKGICIRN